MRDPDTHDRVFTAQAKLEEAVLLAILSRDYAEASAPHADAASKHADDTVAIRARDLVAAVQALPTPERPVGWDAHSFGPFSTEAGATR